mgnify:CR=1 FL=1
MTQDDKLARHYEIAQQRLHNELSLLFQRFNFFLIANSFLITAAAALTASAYNSGGNDSLRWLILAIIVLGGLVSVAFFLINYINAQWCVKVIKNYLNYLNYFDKWAIDIESETKYYYTLFSMHVRMEKYIARRIAPHQWLWKDLCHILRALTNPLETSKNEVAIHTWLIPVAFYLFWFTFTVIVQFTWHWDLLSPLKPLGVFFLATLVVPVIWLSSAFRVLLSFTGKLCRRLHFWG